MNNPGVKTTVLLLLSFALLINFAKAQDPNDNSPIKVDTLLLNIPITVTDKSGHHISGLKKEDFSIYQNGEKQQIEFFLDDDAPMNVAILLDTSFSTRDVLGKIQKAASDFIRIFRPEDKGIIVSFDSETLFLSPLTSDRKELSKAINHANIGFRGGSDMHDAVYKIIRDYFASVKGRKAIIVLTDGMVGGRYISDEQIQNILQKSNTFFYPVIFKTQTNFRINSTWTDRSIKSPFESLQSLAESTAGRFYEKDAGDLKEAFQSIAEELKKQYLIGFYPRNTEKVRQLPIKITVNRKDVTIQAKKSSLKKTN